MIHREPVVQRYLFWATYYGGDPGSIRGRAVQYDIAGYAKGSYTRHEGDHLGTLRRYDREASGLRVGASLDRRAGVWRTSEAPVRDVHRGSDCGCPITIAQAEEIIVELGYGPALLTADVVDV
ncbi:hypothetical protein [Actinoplanes sp. NPDC049681]|uniref:hypothetical protein n=1 Tax=Actinoplanes sp. NPDC049681 TaxID=3363905 RepID=UPI0037BC517C